MNRICPVCNSEINRTLYTQKFYPTEILLFDEYDVVTCNDCGFIYADRIPEQKEFNEYYKNLSKYEFKVNNEQKQHYNKLAHFIFPWLKQTEWCRILDIGCGNGDLLNVFKKAGYRQLLGIDPSSHCASNAYQNYNIDVLTTDIFNFKSNLSKFDFIIMSSVLEHIVDLRKVVEKVASLLEDDGKLFIEVPNCCEFDSYAETGFQQFSVEHVNFFSASSVNNLLNEYFQLLRVETSTHKSTKIIDPTINLIFQKSSEKRNMKKDLYCESIMCAYIKKSYELENILKIKIHNVLQNKKQYIVWGAGTQTLRLLDNVIYLDKVKYFVDSNLRYKGKHIGGKEIIHPTDIQENLPIFISSFAYQDEIVQQIKDLKLQNEVITVNI